MMTRVLAYCLECVEGIAFSDGISSTDEPAVLVRDLTGRLTTWIEMGAPDAERPTSLLTMHSKPDEAKSPGRQPSYSLLVPEVVVDQVLIEPHLRDDLTLRRLKFKDFARRSAVRLLKEFNYAASDFALQQLDRRPDDTLVLEVDCVAREHEIEPALDLAIAVCRDPLVDIAVVADLSCPVARLDELVKSDFVIGRCH